MLSRSRNSARSAVAGRLLLWGADALSRATASRAGRPKAIHRPHRRRRSARSSRAVELSGSISAGAQLSRSGRHQTARSEVLAGGFKEVVKEAGDKLDAPPSRN